MPNSSSNGETSAGPTWLNESFIEKALRSSEEDQNVRVSSYQVSRATADGDNYASDMYRVRVSFTRDGNEESTSLIVKAEPAKEEMAKILEECSIFRREAMALYTVIPKMYNLLSTVSTKQFKPFSAKCLYSQSQPSAIVMEDLKENGFKMAKRMLGLDLKHCLLVMRQIARYHASSAVLHQKNPEIFGPLRESLFNESFRSSLESFFQKSMIALANEVEGWPDYNKRFAAKLHKIADQSVDLLIKTMKRDDSDFNVFTHGDLWLNNMMFLYSDDTQEVEDVRFVDFQDSNFSSPALDLQYFLHTSVSLELFDKHQTLIEEYHKTLGQTLSLLGYEHLTPSLIQLQQQLDKKGIYAIIVCGTILPFVLADPTNIPDVEKMLKDEKKSINFSEQCKTALKKWLPRFESRGWL